MNNANKIAKLTAELETQRVICADLFPIITNVDAAGRKACIQLYLKANTVRSDIKAELRRLKA